MNDVKKSMETIREGNKITKICMEDVYKIVNRIQDAMDKANENSINLFDALENIEYGRDTAIIFGKGISQPCLTDAFDEKIGNTIAFMKAKLNANIKKHNLLVKVYNNYVKLLNKIDEDLQKIDNNIRMDLRGIRNHNQEYLVGIENKLGI